jgi:hypothetical protein
MLAGRADETTAWLTRQDDAEVVILAIWRTHASCA